ncbi:transcription factor bHLH112-like isoform X2 [Tripterygium wilfordii]|uniref:transcription factor bHLH112-like isoform X2 n=1 Tax=Tripterygium wilfordii TaxID=458696 RepID=UPI0018F862B5|nr:transcription factor bHLH112-like isoform X2 [Tripterygium wilfordii]
MAEEFHAGIRGGGWWNMDSSRNVLAGGSPCATAITSNYMGWGVDYMDMKTTSCDQDSNNSASADSFQTPQKPQQQTDSDHSGGSSSSRLIDSTLQMMGFGLQSSSDWNPTSLTGEDSSVLNNFIAMNQEFSLDQQRLNSINTSSNSTTSCQGLSAGFPVSATASYGYTSTLIQSLIETSDPQQSLFNNRSMNYPAAATGNYGTDLNDQLMPSAYNYLKPSLQPTGLHFTNNTPFWNASSGTALSDNKAAGFFPSTQQAQFLGPTTFEKKPNSSLPTKVNTEEVGEMVNKGSNEPPFKKPRIETPSPLPTFKVRKEKLGDRITVLQQLVSPFGKTDTASVLQEAVEYIKFLHDQVNVLSTPYMKNGHSIQQSCDQLDSSEGEKQDLKSRGLCLVPISSTFPVANETNNADYWTPTFGATFR